MAYMSRQNGFIT